MNKPTCHDCHSVEEVGDPSYAGPMAYCKLVFRFKFYFILCVFVHHMHAWCVKSEDGVGSLGTAITDDYEP